MLTWLKKIVGVNTEKAPPNGHAVEPGDAIGNHSQIDAQRNENTEVLLTKPPEPEFTFEIIHPETPDQPVPSDVHPIIPIPPVQISKNDPYAPELELPDYVYPSVDLLEEVSTNEVDLEELEKSKNQLIQTLKSFGVGIQRISATVGPTDTLYEIVPALGVRIAKIVSLKEDIALTLNAQGISIIAPIPGKGTIGISIPNMNRQTIAIRSIFNSDLFTNNKMSLPIALGKRMDNRDYIVDLTTLPHLLVAGATGQGKSVCINSILISLLFKKHPSQLKLVLVDTKQVELTLFKAIEKHFLAKLPYEKDSIITDTGNVVNTLNALCLEMDERYELLKKAGVRNIKDYNSKFLSRNLDVESGHKFLPFIVLVIDEFADIIISQGKEIEKPITRLAQIARAVGIHMIVATQHPSSEVITSDIKANFLGRIAFKVTSKVNSRIILDVNGAEQLIGKGDMLVSINNELERVQCAFIDRPEIERVVEFIAGQKGYASAFELPYYEGEDGRGAVEVDLTNRDRLFEDCARIVVQMQSGSTSNLQRRLNLGYNRAGRIMDQLEAAGIVGPAVGSKPREVYFRTEHELEQFLHLLD